MFKTCVYRWRTFVPVLAVVLTLTSCFGGRKAQRELTYLQGNLDTLPNLTVLSKEATIQKGDLLSIIFFSDDPEATAIYNQQQLAVSSPSIGTGLSTSSGSSSNSSNANLVTNGYPVDQQGNIYIQSLGSVHAEGLTRKRLADSLALLFVSRDLLKHPYASIRFLNFRFTVIGEVNHPGTFTVPEEKISILDMLGMAGDLTIFGRRDNILIVREKDGKREFGKLDLRKADAFQSPYFYLQQNDVVYVEANNKKATLNDQTTLRNLSFVSGFAALISATAIIINLFRK